MEHTPGIETIENVTETSIQKVERLSEMLSGNLDEKVNLYLNQYSNNYGLAKNSFETMMIDPSIDSDEATLFTELYNEYKKDFTLDTASDLKYKVAATDPKTNSTTPQTLEESSFVLKDLLEDMKKHFESK